MGNKIKNFFKLYYLALFWAVWLVVGTPFCILILIRYTFVLPCQHLLAMLTGQGPPDVAQQASSPISLWFDGFRNAYESLYGAPKHTGIEARLGRLALEVVWAMFCCMWISLTWVPETRRVALTCLTFLYQFR